VLDFLKSSRLGNHSGARQRDRDCTQKRGCEADGQCPMWRTGEREVRDEHVESPWLNRTLLLCCLHAVMHILAGIPQIPPELA